MSVHDAHGAKIAGVGGQAMHGLATYYETIGARERSLHELSHGESFLEVLSR